MIIVVGAITLLHVYPVPVLVGECVDAVGEIEALKIAFGLRKIYLFSNSYSLKEPRTTDLFPCSEESFQSLFRGKALKKKITCPTTNRIHIPSRTIKKANSVLASGEPTSQARIDFTH